MPTTTPTTPDNSTPRRMAMNRSFTVPSRLASTNRDAEIGAAEGIETLYVHPSANIIKFTTSGSRPSSSSGSPRADIQQNAGLSWKSTTESTIAAGPLEIYRVPGSVSFLHSGALLHAILPRSQCWCVDGVSKFALRVLPETYYRIELPGEDTEAVEALKEVLKKVLFYERTPCPFVRGFEVEGADVDLEHEVRKGRRRSAGSAKRWTLNRPYSWRPEDGEEIREEGTGESGSDGSGREESEHRRDQDASVGGSSETHEPRTPSRITAPRDYSVMRSVTAPPQLSKRPSVRARVQSVETTEAQRAERTPRPLSMRGLRTLQSIPTSMPPSPPESSVGAEPPELGAAIEPIPQKADSVRRESDHERDQRDENHENHEHEHEIEDEQDEQDEQDESAVPFQLPPPKPRTSFSVQPDSDPTPTLSLPEKVKPVTLHADPPPNPPAVPVTTIPPSPTPHLPPATSPSIQPSSTATTSAKADPYEAIQARIRARRSIGTSASSKPATTTQPKPPSPRPREPKPKPSVPALRPKQSVPSLPHDYTQRSLPTALASKALTLFLGPPAHLVAIMLRIAARFAKGTVVGSVFLVESPPGAGRRVPGSFDFEGEEERVGLDGVLDEDEDWGEDDFGVPLRSPVRVLGGG